MLTYLPVSEPETHVYAGSPCNLAQKGAFMEQNNNAARFPYGSQPKPSPPPPPMAYPHSPNMPGDFQAPAPSSIHNGSRRPHPTWVWVVLGLSIAMFLAGAAMMAHGQRLIRDAENLVTSTSPLSSSTNSWTPPSDIDVEKSQLSFGDTAVWDDNLEVTISAPKSFELDEFDQEYYGKTGYTPLEVKVEVSNNTGIPVETVMFMTDMLSGGEQSERLYQCAEGYSSMPNLPLSDGKTLAYTACFMAKDASDLEVIWSGEYGRASVSFQ